MARLNVKEEPKMFLTIGKGGTGETMLRQSVSEGTPDSVARHWEVNGEKGTKYELLFPSIEGKITNVEIKKEEEKGYGDKIQLTFDGEITVSTKTTSKFGSSIMRQLPNVDFTKEVKLQPYSYTPKGKDKEVTGVSIKQGETFDDRVGDAFYDFEKKESKNGIPEPDFDWSNVQDWQKDKFWSEVDAFLQSYTLEKVVPTIPAFIPETSVGEETEPVNLGGEQEDVDPEDMPF